MVSFANAALLEPLVAEVKKLGNKGEQILSQRPQRELAKIDCGPGCGSCCVLNVSTLLTEGLAIVQYVSFLDGDEQSRVAERLETLWREVRGVDDEERLIMRRRCAFLTAQGRCSIYPVRPLLCRSITSLDARSCRDALSGAVFGAETGVLMYQYQQQLYDSLFAELAEKLETRGIDGRGFPLTGLVRYLLNHPDSVESLLGGHRLDWQDLY